ncbi:hypothetical protein BDQ17DRAFT_621360 [Cyathus striatus]|nr:hypothetical protein BDQ17DRAFT_621360 [Cyathus striatus]
MTNTTQPITFPEGLASKILWSPHIDHVSGRNSRASYVLVTSDSQSRLAPPSAEDLTPSSKEVSITETKISDASMEPVSPVAGELNAGLDDATEPIINNIVTADNSSSNGEETQTQDDLTIPNLPDSIQNEINARVSYKFTADVQMEAIKAHKTFLAEKKPIVEPVVHLYCPHGGCHEIIDKAVRTIAKHEGAEILTLDAFELSSAGIYGDQFYEALSASYRHPIIPNEIVENKASSNSDTDKDSSGCSSIEESAKECRKEGTEQCGEADKGKQEEEIQIQTRKDEELKKLDSGVQAIFDSLISISSCQNLQDSAASTKKRIIYIRDFGSIAKVAAAFIVRLLCAIHARRTAKFSDGVKSEDLIQPTILILGYSNTTNDISESVFVRGGETLRKALPSIGAECLREDLTSITLSPIASRFFLGSLVVEGENKSSHSYDSDDDHLSIVLKLSLFKLLSDMAMPKSMTSVTTSSASSSLKELKCSVFNGPTFSLDSFDLSSASLAMSIFFKGPEKEAFTALEKSLCDRRMTSMANAWFRISLAQRRRRLACDDVIAFLGDDEDLQKDLVLEEKKKKRGQGKKDLEKPKEHSPYKGRDLLARLAQLTDSSISVTLDQAVAIALGLGNPGQTSELDIPEVPFSAFSKAFRILIHNHKSRTEWRNEQSELEEEDDDSEDRDDEDEDPVVKAVKNADNLTQHESQMLSCIVNPSM